MARIEFGTDGWRAVIAEDFTFENVRIVTQAIADYVKESFGQNPKLAAGYDTRFMSKDFAKVACEVLAGNGIEVLLSDSPATTPAVSLAIKEKKLDGGIMITASHNPPKYNGIKFKTQFAGSAGVEITKKIEGNLYKHSPLILGFDQAVKEGKIKIHDAKPDYVRFVNKYIDMRLLKNKKFKVIFDALHGAAAEYPELILKNTKLNIEAINKYPDPLFGGVLPEPIEKNLPVLKKMMKAKKYDIGLAFDGDGDRIGAMRPDGRFVSSGEIICLLLLHMYQDKGLKGAVAKTISGTSMIEKVANSLGLKLYETPVGFKNIYKLMLEEDILIGGEESGGIGYKGYIPERDGVLGGLLLLEMMAYRKKGIIKIMDEVEKKFGRHYYLREDIEYPQEMGARLYSLLKQEPFADLAGKKVTQVKDYDGYKFIAKDNSWILFRLSGTEPILRIYCEALSSKRVKDIMNFGKKYAFAI